MADGDHLDEVLLALRDLEETSAETKKLIDQEVNKRGTLYTSGFARGKVFTGVVVGALAHVQYQLEGSRVMAMASVNEARHTLDYTWLHSPF